MALHAYIDESGQIGTTPRSSDHFVMSAVVCRDTNLGRLDDLLTRLRRELRRADDDRLSWKMLKRADDRMSAARMIGQAKFLKTVSIIVCKRHLNPPMRDTHAAYLYTLRFLLERLSWLGRENTTSTYYTLSHVRHFRVASLRTYESKLLMMGARTKIEWDNLSPPGRVTNDRAVQALQVADLVASATASAFEASANAPADQRHLLALLPRAYRGNPRKENVLSSYGLKMHPWNRAVRAEHPWITALR